MNYETHFLGGAPIALTGNATTLHFGVQNTGNRGGYYATVPNVSGKDELKKNFSFRNYQMNAYQAACDWVNLEGIKIWGIRAWEEIKSGSRSRYTCKKHGVTAFIKTFHYNTKTERGRSYQAWIVCWHDKEGKSHSEYFSPIKLNGMKKTELAAKSFATEKRNEMTQLVNQ